MRVLRAAILALASASLLNGPAAFARDQAPGAQVGPNGTAWAAQCIAESRTPGGLGHACCANLRAACLDACNSQECDGPVDACVGARTTCYQECERAYHQCLGAQTGPKPPAGRSTPVPPNVNGGVVR